MSKDHPHSSRLRYRAFLQDYKQQRLEDPSADADKKPQDDSNQTNQDASAPERLRQPRGKRREYLREYIRWLWPHRFGIAAVFLFAMVAAGLQMIEPLFMHFIVDSVLLPTDLDSATRLTRLHVAGTRSSRSSSFPA